VVLTDRVQANQSEGGMKRETKSAWSDVIESLKTPTIGPDDMTIERMMEKTGAGRESVRRELEKKVKRGEAVKEVVCYGGRRISLYRPKCAPART
jgi:response regulator of citrate/malate metabolism